MNSYNIRLGHTDSVHSNDTENYLDVELKNTTKLIHHNDIKETIDQLDQFKKERGKCNKYRLILTINPYCTNILFNTLTEIVKDEGSVDVEVIHNMTSKAKPKNAIGTQQPERFQMVRNTEYSNEKNGYTYLPGYDIFNNHILRNLTFKLVNINNSKGNDNFNTLSDLMREANGDQVTEKKRFSTGNEIKHDSFPKHLYLFDDVLSVEDSINANLTEENGWYGFVNNNVIPSQKHESGKWVDMDISRVLNDKKNCEFVDMYPDRTLYSFNPKYNKFRHRLEYNWDVVITYPYENVFDYDLLTNGNVNALLLMSVEKVTGLSGEEVLMCRSLIKHNLERGDRVYFYTASKGTSDFTKTEKTFRVTNIGDLNKKNSDYFFYVSDTDLNSIVDFTQFEVRFTRVVDDIESKYYVRKFQKLPNLKARRENLTDEIVQDKETFEQYIEDNAKLASGMMREFDKEQYKLAFASTIYNDDATQITFTDTIDISCLVDNLGRPLSEMYATLIKTNRGHEEWIAETFNKPEVEYSHCFGKISSGVNLYVERGETGDTDKASLLGGLSEIHMLNEIGLFGAKSLPETNDDGDIRKDEQDDFYGDVVEYCPAEAREIVLEAVNHRFNTLQREYEGSFYDSFFPEEEITSDDYSKIDTPATFETSYTNGSNYQTKQGSAVSDNPCIRPEGYYYQPHYEIKLRDLSDVQQASHVDLKIKSVKPIQYDNILLRVVTTLSHNLSVGNKVYLCDDMNDVWFVFDVVNVENRTTFSIFPSDGWDGLKTKSSTPTSKDVDIINLMRDLTERAVKYDTPLTWFNICNMLLSEEKNTKLALRRVNINIPSYAQYVGGNRFVWRNIIRAGEMGSDNIPEYPYTNDAFYINKEINFFLKRQDPHGYFGLYARNNYPNDISGENKKESNYIYKDESEVTC